MKEENSYDVVIVGGSYAGLAAALTLGRSIKKALVVDSGKPCNLQTPHSHNFLTQDGKTPAAIAELGKSQVRQYPTVEFKNDLVIAAEGTDNNFSITLASGEIIKTRKLLFTTGIKDLLPNLKGFAECWGISVIHCPYCHGYEHKGQRTGILANGTAAFEFGRLISNWAGDLTIFTNGKSTISEAEKQQLLNNKISVVEKELKEIEHKNGYLSRVVFADDSIHELDALYARVPFEQHCKVPETMGCELSESGHLVIDQRQQTSVPGIYAAGDNTTMMRSVAQAVATGNFAGAMINLELIMSDFQ